MVPLRSCTRSLLVVLVASGLGLPAAYLGAQAPIAPDEQARRLLQDGLDYRRDGKNKQALDNFNTIVSGFPSSDSVDDALLEIGRYYLDVENNADKAREAFDRVAKQFPQSDGAPGAYYYLGLLALRRATTPAALDDAQAQFRRVQRLYARSDWVPRALHAEGQALRKAGRLEDAIDVQRRAALEYPASDAAPAAQYELGHCLALLGQPRAAMEEFQQVRNRYPRSPWAARAYDRTTALWRLHGGERAVFALDPAFSVGAGDVLKDVRGLLMTPEGTLWIASDKASMVVPYDPAGKMGAGMPGQDVRSLSLSPDGQPVVSARLAVRLGASATAVHSLSIPSDKPGVPEPLEKLTAAALTPGGSLLVADERRKRIYRFDGSFQHQGVFADGRERAIVKLLVDGEGAVVALDREERALTWFDETGKVLRSLPLRAAGYDLRKPVDFALDEAGNVYVADEQAGVHVLSSRGQLLARLGGEELRRPVALTLEPSGAVLVYDDRAARVLRYR